MDSVEQAAGEKRVKDLLIEPLLRQGLGKPTTVDKAGFAAMQTDLCQRLAYMSPVSLEALAQVCAAHPGGPQKDRFPIGRDILDHAGKIQPPSDDGSPLLRAVFSQQLGLDALVEGFAPELYGEIKRVRKWPNPFVVNQIKGRASDNIRRMRTYDERLAGGDVLAARDDDWRRYRLEVIRRCERIRDLAILSGAGE